MNLNIHVGAGKTGTTFLQEEVFSKHKDINYLGKSKAIDTGWLISLQYSDDFLFDKKKQEFKTSIHQLFDTDRVNLLSSEAFISRGGVYYNQSRRICEVFDDPKIIITLRDPLDAIVSFYKYNVMQGNIAAPLEESIDWKRTPMVFFKRKPIYLPDFYYDEIISSYRDLVGEENLCVLRYEDMLSNPENFFSQLGDFVGGIKFDIDSIKKELKTKVNKSPENADINKLRAKNIYMKMKQLFPESKVGIEDIVYDDTPVIGEKLRSRLEEKLRGKCFGYY